MARRLEPEDLWKGCDRSLFGFATTDELPALEGIIGQDRALASIDFGLSLRSAGFNLYVLGDSGTGRVSAIRAFLRQVAEKEPVPSDWVYVHNFQDAGEPIALSIAPGQAAGLQRDMAELTAALRVEIPKVYESKEYKREKTRIVEEFQNRQKEFFRGLEEEAKRHGFVVRGTIGEFTLSAVGPKGEPLTEEEYAALDERTKVRLREEGKIIRERVDDLVRMLKKDEKATRESVAELDRTAALSVLGHLVEEIAAKYVGNEKLLAWLGEVRDDVLKNIADFKAPQEETETPQLPFLRLARPEVDFQRYSVNVLVNNGGLKGSPCVFESNPTYYNLFGRMEHRLHMGAALTDFTMIKAGALHKANGGYLVVNALDLLRNLFSYDAVKRAIRNREVRIEDVWEQYRLVSTTMMKPEPIPLDVKIILIGSPEIYYLLYALDTDYRELFKVKADFDSRIDRTDGNVRKYASFVATKAREDGLRPFDASAVATVVEFGSRIAGDKEKLTSRFSDISNLLRESHYWARKDGAAIVSGSHVEKAWSEKIYRHSLLEARMREVVAEGTIIVETTGAKVGQVNGLAVIDLGDYAFGKPSRITASVYAGRGGVMNIERETKLSGKIHEKAILILSNWLGRQYAGKKPVSLTASITFEQLYGLVEGDSATCAETYALLSAISGMPVRQGIAVTGSMDQSGNVQPVGGVNEKVEGFFDICRLRGLDGTQGVVLPSRNVRSLMLRKDVVEAVRNGTFSIYAMDGVEEGIELLFGAPAGERGADGTYPAGTLNAAVDARLEELRKAVKAEGQAEKDGQGRKNDE